MQSSIKIQVLTFILHTVIRTFIHSSAAGIYVNVFHFSHIGKLTGLGSIAGAIFSLIMDPLMKLVNGPLDGNPYIVSITGSAGKSQIFMKSISHVFWLIFSKEKRGNLKIMCDFFKMYDLPTPTVD